MSDVKLIRKQIKNVVQDLLPQILTTELLGAIEMTLRKEINDRLNLIDQRQKEIQGYMVRQSARPVTAPQVLTE